MAIYAQHGHAKSDRLDSALDDGTLDGVIVGARNEPPDSVAGCIEVLKPKGEVLFDPQFFVSTFAPPNDRYLPNYSYYKAGLSSSAFTGAKKLTSICKAVIDFQVELGTDKIISPTVFCDGFETKWGQIALNLAETSLEYHSTLADPPPLLVNFLISEPALTSRKDTESFLDQVTAWEMYGAYLVIAREDSTYSQSFDPQRFAHALYMTYVLGEVSGFEVVNGYTDFCGLLYRVAGSSAFATGWWQSLRQFNKKAFIKQKPGGAQARLRYSSGPLMNSIFLSELEQIRDADLLDDVLSGIGPDELLANDSEAWTTKVSELAHWQTLSQLDAMIPNSLTKRLNHLDAQLDSAAALYFKLEEAGVVLSNATGPAHINAWSEALATFKGLVGKS